MTVNELNRIVESFKQMDTLKTILEKHNHPVEFSLMGRKFVVPAERNAYAHFKDKYYHISQAYPGVEDYFEVLTSLQEVAEGEKTTLLTLTGELFAIVSMDAASVGIYTLDENEIERLCETGKYTAAFDAAIAQYYVEKWEDIVDDINTYGESAETAAKAEQVFRDPLGRHFVENGIRLWISNMAEMILDTVYGTEGYKGVITGEHAQKALSLYHNLELDLGLKEKADIVHQMLSLNPLNTMFYSGCILRFEENAEEFITIAKHFGLVTEEFCKETAEEYVKLHTDQPNANYVQCIASIDRMAVLLDLDVTIRNQLHALADESIALNLRHNAMKLILECINKNMGGSHDDGVDEIVAELNEYNSGTSNAVSLEEILSIWNAITEKAEIMGLDSRLSASAFDVVREKAIQCLESYADNHAGTTVESMQACRNTMRSTATEMGLSEAQMERAKKNADMQAVRILEEYTQNELPVTELGVTRSQYRISDMAAQLGLCDSHTVTANELMKKRLFAYLCDRYNESLSTTEEEELERKNMIVQMAEKWGLDSESYSPLLVTIDKKLALYDLQYRTVGKIVAKTRQEADVLRSLEQDPSLYHFRWEHLNQIRSIETAPIDPETKTQALRKYRDALRDFDNICKKAARYEHYCKHKNPFWNGDIPNMLGSYAILVFALYIGLFNLFSPDSEAAAGVVWLVIAIAYFIYMITVRPKKHKKEWDRVTDNGNYKFTDIIADKPRSSY